MWRDKKFAVSNTSKFRGRSRRARCRIQANLEVTVCGETKNSLYRIQANLGEGWRDRIGRNLERMHLFVIVCYYCRQPPIDICLLSTIAIYYPIRCLYLIQRHRRPTVTQACVSLVVSPFTATLPPFTIPHLLLVFDTATSPSHRYSGLCIARRLPPSSLTPHVARI